MKHILLSVLLLSSSFAFADDAQNIDNELNTVYQQALKNNPTFSDKIKTSQRDWLKFIQSDCASYTIAVKDQLPQTNWVFNECISTQKQQRTKTIKDIYLQQN